MDKHLPVAENSFRMIHQSIKDTYAVSNNASIFSGACFQVLVGSVHIICTHHSSMTFSRSALVIPRAVSVDAKASGPGAIRDQHSSPSKILVLEGELLCPTSYKLEDGERR